MTCKVPQLKTSRHVSSHGGATLPIHHQAQNIARYVAYEVEMFFKTIDQLEHHQGQDDLDDNQRLENVLLHARVIYNFLFTTPHVSYPGVSARDFSDNPSHWFPGVDVHCPHLKQRRERLNRLVHHLSYDRIDYRQTRTGICTRLPPKSRMLGNSSWIV